jgi:hypothetical protein
MQKAGRNILFTPVLQQVLNGLVRPGADISTRFFRSNAIILQCLPSQPNFIHLYPNETLNSVGLSTVQKTQISDGAEFGE